MKTTALCLFLIACGVDPRMEADIAAIEASYGEGFQTHLQKVVVIVDTAAVENNPHERVGFTNGKTVVLPEHEWYAKRWEPKWWHTIIAHELGHAFGIYYHTETGIMRERPDVEECVGREGECLREAMVTAGLEKAR